MSGDRKMKSTVLEMPSDDEALSARLGHAPRR